jgi:hypothetical protein
MDQSAIGVENDNAYHKNCSDSISKIHKGTWKFKSIRCNMYINLNLIR